MFYGEFEYKLDEKGRLLVPPAFRRELKDGVVLTSGAEKCITAYPAAGWKKLADSLTGGTLSASKMRTLKRSLFASAFPMAMDGQSRITLPAPLREYAGIGDEVVVAGVNECFELWNKEQWAAEKATSQQQAWQIIESLERQ